MEEKLEYYGASVEDEHSARWIYRQGTEKRPNNAALWQVWSNFEVTAPNRIRGFEIPYTAEWLAETGYRYSKSS